MDAANNTRNTMTKHQQSTLNIFIKAASELEHWNQNETEELTDGSISVSFTSSKGYQESVQGRIGTRGAFYRWTINRNNDFIEQRERANIIANVYIR